MDNLFYACLHQIKVRIVRSILIFCTKFDADNDSALTNTVPEECLLTVDLVADAYECLPLTSITH